MTMIIKVEILHLVMEHRSMEKPPFPFFRNLAYSKFSTQDCTCYSSIGIRISSLYKYYFCNILIINKFWLYKIYLLKFCRTKERLARP